jgi:hypothetical protein
MNGEVTKEQYEAVRAWLLAGRPEKQPAVRQGRRPGLGRRRLAERLGIARGGK